MQTEEGNKTTMETRNVDWSITPGPDGKIPDGQVTHALLIDIRGTARSIHETARSIRKMVLFFTVLAVLNCIGLLIWLIAH